MDDLNYKNITEDNAIGEDFLSDIMYFPETPVEFLRNRDGYENVRDFLSTPNFTYKDEHGEKCSLKPTDKMNGSFEDPECALTMLGLSENVVLTYPDEFRETISSEEAQKIYENVIFEEDRTTHVHGGFNNPNSPYGIYENHIFAIVDEVNSPDTDPSDLKSYLFSIIVDQDELMEQVPEEAEEAYKFWGKGDGEHAIEAVKEFVEE